MRALIRYKVYSNFNKKSLGNVFFLGVVISIYQLLNDI